jgi:hypothetical protein
MDDESIHVDDFVLVLDDFRAKQTAVESRMMGDGSQCLGGLQATSHVEVVEV